jgi:hypothetical protein
MDNIKSSNIPPSTMLDSLLTIPVDFFSQVSAVFCRLPPRNLLPFLFGSPQSKNVASGQRMSFTMIMDPPTRLINTTTTCIISTVALYSDGGNLLFQNLMLLT